MIELIQIPTDQLQESRWNPRKHIDIAKLNDLASSIHTQGVLEPLLVRQITEEGYEIIAGHRRFRAAQMAGVDSVPCLIRTLTDAEALEIAIVENSQRVDVHPIEDAEAIAHLMQIDPAYTVEAVAAKLGVHVTTVNRKLRLLRLEPIVREAYAANAITAAHAERLTKLPADQQRAGLEECFSYMLVMGESEAVEEEEGMPAGLRGFELMLHAKAWDRLAKCLSGVRDLDEWIERHAKADVVGDDTVKQLVLDQLSDEDITALSDESDEFTNIVQALPQLSCAEMMNPKDIAALGVLPASQWADCTDKPCEHAKKGVVVHGSETPRVVSFCRKSKKCQEHWPTEPKSEPNPARDEWEREERENRERAQTDRARFEAAKPRLYAAIAEHAATIQFKPQLLRQAVYDEGVEQLYGIKLELKNVAQYLACVIVGVHHYSAADLKACAKGIGFDLTKVLKQIEKEQKAAEKAEAKAAKKKGAA